MNALKTRLGEIPFLLRSNRYSATNNVRAAHFYCVAPQANAVFLVGDFNGWNPLANRMEHQPDGSWMAQVELHHGYHHYLFLVDGEPMLDPAAHGIARNARNEPVSLMAVS